MLFIITFLSNAVLDANIHEQFRIKGVGLLMLFGVIRTLSAVLTLHIASRWKSHVDIAFFLGTLYC